VGLSGTWYCRSVFSVCSGVCCLIRGTCAATAARISARVVSVHLAEFVFTGYGYMPAPNAAIARFYAASTCRSISLRATHAPHSIKKQAATAILWHAALNPASAEPATTPLAAAQTAYSVAHIASVAVHGVVPRQGRASGDECGGHKTLVVQRRASRIWAEQRLALHSSMACGMPLSQYTMVWGMPSSARHM
jgi:hypothetical protein